MQLDADDIVDLAQVRSREFQTDRDRWNKMSMIYRGQHRALFPTEFRDGEIEKIAGFIRRSWKMFQRLVAKVPDKRVAALSLKKRDEARAERQEKILFTYDNLWDMRRRMKVWAHYQVGYGALAAGVVADMKTKTPMLLVEDPRNALPGPGWDATTVPGMDFTTAVLPEGQTHADLGSGLEDIIIRKVLTGGQLRRLYPDSAELQVLVPDTRAGFNTRFTVFNFYDQTHVTTVIDGGLQLGRAPHGAPYCPWRFQTSFVPDQPGGDSDFEQQIGLEIAFMRILDQKLSLNDLITFPWMKQKGFVEFDPAKRHIKLGSSDADADFLTPPATFQVDRDLAQVGDLLRKFNFETEGSQGGVSGGPITGRGLSELSKVVVETVQEHFDDNASNLACLYKTALHIDKELFEKDTKLLAGWGRGETFLEEYTPGKDIGDRFGQVTVEFGPGLGGFEGHLQMLQDLGAEAISTDTIMEKNPHIHSVGEEKRKLLLKKIDDLMFGEAMQGQVAVPFDWLVALRKEIESGRDWQEWIIQHPPGQALSTPDNTGPVAPEVAAAGAENGINYAPGGSEAFGAPLGFGQAPPLFAPPGPPGGAKTATPPLGVLG